MFAVHPDEACRTAGREASEAADRFFNSFRINSDAYRILRAIDLDGTDGPTRFAVEKMLRDLRRGGAEKDAAARARLLELSNEIDRVSNQYNENVAKLERAVEVEGVAGLSGLPPDFLANHTPDPDGRTRITTRYPDFHPVMAYADYPELRRRLLYEFMNRAHPENEPILERLLAARFELATSLGYPAYAHYAIEDKMMERPEAVRTFLDRIATVLRARRRSISPGISPGSGGTSPSAGRLELWDAGFFGEGYYDGKLRTEEFGVDTKRLRAYLPYRVGPRRPLRAVRGTVRDPIPPGARGRLVAPDRRSLRRDPSGTATGPLLPRPRPPRRQVWTRGVLRDPGRHRRRPAPPERSRLQFPRPVQPSRDRPDAGPRT